MAHKIHKPFNYSTQKGQGVIHRKSHEATQCKRLQMQSTSLAFLNGLDREGNQSHAPGGWGQQNHGDCHHGCPGRHSHTGTL